MSDSAAAVDDVILGPDLNATRSKSDKKLYRHITLGNGLKCVLICDVLAMRQRELLSALGHRRCNRKEADEDSDESEDDDDDESDGNSIEEDDESEDDGDGLRKAATALLVNVGSYHDPPYLQGLSHFLEHMLFLGTETFPNENEYDKFLSSHGGDDNAYTDMEHTLYHYCIPQDNPKYVWKGLEMFSTFFKCPLLNDHSMERELNAVQSEFELNRKDDDNRLSQLMAYTCGMDGGAPIMGKQWCPATAATTATVTMQQGGTRNETEIAENEATEGDEMDVVTATNNPPYHPFAKFPWGNMSSLKTEPELANINVIRELRKHYQNHYFARNMRLVVMAGYDLDEIQRHVVRHFIDVPSIPRQIVDTDICLPIDGSIVNNNDNVDEKNCITNLHPYGLPFHTSSLAKAYRIIPVCNYHLLTITWQIPSITPNWRTKPSDYLAHLIGHEASGSILSVLKDRGWAMSVSVGTGEDGQGDASTHALFCVEISLSICGMKYWEDVVRVVFVYIGMLKYHFLEGNIVDDNDDKMNMTKREGLPNWIYNELKMIANVSYQFADEGDVTDIVEDIADRIAPWSDLPDERALDGYALLFDDEVDNDMVKRYLFDYFTPENIRIDLMSSLFGQDADYSDDSTGQEEKKADTVDFDGTNTDCTESHIFDKVNAGPASIEPRFGTKYWEEKISDDLIQCWKAAAMPQLPSSDELLIHLPPQNTYIPTMFDLRPADYAEHPLLNCSVKVCVTVGKMKLHLPASVIKYRVDETNHYVCLSYEDEEEKWHLLDNAESYGNTDNCQDTVEYSGTLDGGLVKFRVTAFPRDGERAVFNYGDASHDEDVEDGKAFPPLPPPTTASRLPQLIYDNNCVRMWHLQDRRFKRPIADLRLHVECDGMQGSALNQACMELFCKLCTDSLTETCYLASVCELGSSLRPTDTGFSIRVHGFDQHLLTLTKEVLKVAMSFRGIEGECALPPTIKKDRFHACVELQLRRYSNAGMDAQGFATSLRLLCLRPSVKSSFSKLKAFRGITPKMFIEVMTQLLKHLSIECLYHGNISRKDADEAVIAITDLCGHYAGLPEKQNLSKDVLKVRRTSDQQQIIVPTIDHKDPNTAVEVYFQFGRDDNSPSAVRPRVLVDVLEQILEEPLYNQIRTKDQFGYIVSCGARWTCKLVFMSNVCFARISIHLH